MSLSDRVLEFKEALSCAMCRTLSEGMLSVRGCFHLLCPSCIKACSAQNACVICEAWLVPFDSSDSEPCASPEAGLAKDLVSPSFSASPELAPNFGILSLPTMHPESLDNTSLIYPHPSSTLYMEGALSGAEDDSQEGPAFLEEENVPPNKRAPRTRKCARKRPDSPHLLGPRKTGERKSMGVGEPERILIAVSGLCDENFSFLCGSCKGLGARLGVEISVSPWNVEGCTHLVTETDARGLCKRTKAYIDAVMYGKAIVSFQWYLGLFDMEKPVHEQTWDHLVRGDRSYGPSGVAERALFRSQEKLFFSNVNIVDPHGCLDETAKRLLYEHGGTVNFSLEKRAQISVESRSQFYDLISAGKDLFSARGCPGKPGA